jgi:hypothetical protein
MSQDPTRCSGPKDAELRRFGQTKRRQRRQALGLAWRKVALSAATIVDETHNEEAKAHGAAVRAALVVEARGGGLVIVARGKDGARRAGEEAGLGVLTESGKSRSHRSQRRSRISRSGS